MKKTKLLLTAVLSLSFGFSVRAQVFSKEFGIIGKDEIELKQYSLDKDAEAVVLFDIGKSYFVETENSFDVIFERMTRIKIISESGIKWAEVEIPFYQEGGIYEKVKDIEANTYNYENGIINKTQFINTNTYDVKINSFWNTKKFAIPDVKAGSIIEYKYKIYSQYKFNLRDWEFQWKIPVVYSEYDVRMIPFYEYSWIFQGAKKFDSQVNYVDNGWSRQFGSISFNDMVHKYIMEDTPAFKDEEFISSINDYIIKIDFQLSKIIYPNGGSAAILTTLEEMIQDLIKNQDFYKYVKKSEKLTTSLIDIQSLSNKTSKEKFDFILDYVKSNYNWNKDTRKYATKSPNMLIEEKLGNSAEINLFAIGLLNGIGINAYPLLISTRDNGKIKDAYPFSHFFDNVLIIANVDGQYILSDATEVLASNDRIPARCINDKGLIIQKDTIEWVGLECLFPSELNTDIIIKIVDNSTLEADITVTATEYDALYYRNNYTADIERVKKKLVSKDSELIDSTISVQNQLNKEKPYLLSYSLTSKLEILNEKIYLSPFLDESISDNPLKQIERTYPIDMIYPTKRSFKSTLIIPDGYQVEFKPKGQKINTQLFELNYSITNDNEKVSISYDYYFKKSVYPSSDYAILKSYFNEIIKRSNEKVVLSKMNLVNN